MEINYSEIEKKWQKKWEENGVNSFNPKNIDRKLYCMEMFSYPSGANLHLGHWFNFGLSDSWARFKKMQGYEVFHPMGFDAFGLPAENYAIKTNTHPSIRTYESIETMRRQLKEMGGMTTGTTRSLPATPAIINGRSGFLSSFTKKASPTRKRRR